MQFEATIRAWLNPVYFRSGSAYMNVCEKLCSEAFGEGCSVVDEHQECGGLPREKQKFRMDIGHFFRKLPSRHYGEQCLSKGDDC